MMMVQLDGGRCRVGFDNVRHAANLAHARRWRVGFDHVRCHATHLARAHARCLVVVDAHLIGGELVPLESLRLLYVFLNPGPPEVLYLIVGSSRQVLRDFRPPEGVGEDIGGR